MRVGRVDAVLAAATFLEDQAFGWWRARYERNDRDPSWDAFSAAIRDRFQLMDDGKKARLQVKELRQTGGIRAYTQEFQRLDAQHARDESNGPGGRLRLWAQARTPGGSGQGQPRVGAARHEAGR